MISCYKTITISTLLSLNKQQNYHIYHSSLWISKCVKKCIYIFFPYHVISLALSRVYFCLHVFISSNILYRFFSISCDCFFFRFQMNHLALNKILWRNKNSSCAYVVNMYSQFLKVFFFNIFSVSCRFVIRRN